jgi:hypothetical protein
LIPTLQAPRFGLPSDERDAFTAAYGQDVRTWDGYPEPTARTHRATSRIYAYADERGAASVCGVPIAEVACRLLSARGGGVECGLGAAGADCLGVSEEAGRVVLLLHVD